MLQKFKNCLNKLDQPFYIFDKEKLKNKLNYSKHFNGKILYAVKANPSNFIIDILSKMESIHLMQRL